jgi:hypothetical protein
MVVDMGSVPSKYSVRATLTAVNTTSDCAIQFRHSGTGNSNRWRLNITTTTFVLQKVVSSTLTTVATVSQVRQAGDVIRIDVAGNDITVYVNGAQIAATTDSALASNSFVGFQNGGTTTVMWDDFYAYEIPSGSISSILGGVTSSLNGSVSSGNSGDIAATLGGVTSSLEAREVNAGDAASTLGGVTASLTGSQAEAEATSGDIAATLGGVTAALQAREDDAGELAATLGGVTASLQARETATGTLAGLLSGVTTSLEAREVNAGDAASTLGGVTVSLTANEVDSGDIAATLGGVTASLEGSTGIVTGGIASTLGGVTASLEANEVDAGDIAATLGGVTAGLEGSVSEPNEGDITATLGGVTASLTGGVGATGDITATLGGATCAMQGEAEAPTKTGGWKQLQSILDEIRSQPSTPHMEPLWPNEIERHRPARPAVVTQYVPVPITEDDQRWGE